MFGWVVGGSGGGEERVLAYEVIESREQSVDEFSY